VGEVEVVEHKIWVQAWYHHLSPKKEEKNKRTRMEVEDLKMNCPWILSLGRECSVYSLCVAARRPLPHDPTYTNTIHASRDPLVTSTSSYWSRRSKNRENAHSRE
jgi:hypothetical protein